MIYVRYLRALISAFFATVVGCSTSVISHAGPLRAQDVADSIGVNVHVMYLDTSYANLDAVIDSLKYLGVTALREAPPRDSPQSVARYGKLAEAGFHFEFTVRNDIPTTVARIDDFARRHPGALIAIEGPNEVNNWPVTFAGQTGSAGATAYQTALFDTVKADPLLRDLPVYNLTDYPDLAGKADYANLHPYPAKGRQPFTTLSKNFAIQTSLMPGKPVVLTEAGYFTLLGKVAWGGVDAPTQAKLVVNLLLDALSLGMPRTFLYELLDERQDRQKQTSENHFGLFDLSYKPKPAATAMHNLTALLADSDTSARRFPLRTFTYSIQGLPATAKTLLIEKADGSDMIVIWDEPQIWDSDKEASMPIDEKTIAVLFGNPQAAVSLYDPLASEREIQSFQNVRQVQIPLADRAIVVIVHPKQ